MTTPPLTSPAKLQAAQQAYADLPMMQRTMTGSVVVPLLDVLESIIEDLERIKNAAA